MNPEKTTFGNTEHGYEMIRQLEEAGFQVFGKEELDEHFAVIDDEVVWNGGVNLLGKEDAWDNLMRIKSVDVAEELLELVLGKENRETDG